MTMSYYDQSYPPSLWTVPPVIPVTGVIAGTPGAFTPANSDIPNNLAELIALGALGQTTAWTTGQYVVLGDASNAYWNGTTWVTGIAAVVEETTTQPEPEYSAVKVEDLPADNQEPETE